MVAPCETRVGLQTLQQKQGVCFQLSSWHLHRHLRIQRRDWTKPIACCSLSALTLQGLQVFEDMFFILFLFRMVFSDELLYGHTVFLSMATGCQGCCRCTAAIGTQRDVDKGHGNLGMVHGAWESVFESTFLFKFVADRQKEHHNVLGDWRRYLFLNVHWGKPSQGASRSQKVACLFSHVFIT